MTEEMQTDDSGQDGLDGDPSEGQQQEPAEGQQDGGQQQATGEAPEGSRKDRRKVWNDNQRLRRENEDLARRVAEVTARQVGDAVSQGLERTVERLAPPKPSEEDAAFEEVVEAARSLNPNDPKTLRRFAEAQKKMSLAGLDIGKMVQEKVAEALPPQRPEPVRRLHAEFDWAADHEQDIAYHARRIARQKGRDMRDGRVLYATLREAALHVAKDFDLPVPTRHDQTAGDRFSGAGGRTGSARGGDAPAMDKETLARIDEAAAYMYPELAAPARRAKWLKENGHVMKPR